MFEDRPQRAFQTGSLVDAEILIFVRSGQVIGNFVVSDDGKEHGLFVMTRG